ncbi:MAG: cytochrome c3 family protein [Tepidisphaerales bacterium]
MKQTVFSVILVLIAAAAWAAPPSVTDGPHNLGVAGPGRKAASEQQLCIPCHAPHVTVAVKPLWDTDSPPVRGKLMAARAGDAGPGQPTGVSKLCLSCHDGTIATMNMVARGQPVQMAERMTTVSRGKPRAGTDLADDHPVSFRFDAALSAKHNWLREPPSPAGDVKLDAGDELQCTTCHDPHDNGRGKFLVVANGNSELCNTCHQVGPTTVEHHQQCLGCHQNHTAPSGSRLLRQATITGTCTTCHGAGTTPPQGPNIAAEIRKFANHDTNPPIDLTSHAPGDSACSDCHDPHTMRTALATAPSIRGNFGQVAGISARGMPVHPAKYEYEVCFRCHADKQDLEPVVSRVIHQTNMRLKLSTSAVSFHPVEGRGTNLSVPSLRPGLTTASTIYCTDCHSSDSGRKAGGSGASGPHGSENTGLLIDRYELGDYTSEGSQTYALCYRCHDRNSILSNQSFKLHAIHIVTSKTTCSTCHDPHGISSAQGTPLHNRFLINFDVRIVLKSAVGKREFSSLGVRSGTCTLKCHGVDHIGFQY